MQITLKTLAVTVALTMLATGPAASADPTREAILMCRAMDSTGLGSSPCEVGLRTITLHVDMVASEARNLCTMMQDYARKESMGFGGDWRLDIKSPYSGGQSIAFCMLP